MTEARATQPIPNGRKLVRGRRTLLATPPVALAVVLGAWLAIHRVPWLGPAIADSARAVFGPSAVAWAEDAAYAWQDRYDRWSHGGDAPHTYWDVAPPASAPSPSTAAARSETAVPAGDQPFPPAPARILFPAVASQADGAWLPVPEMTRADGRPIVAKTMVHPDRERPYTVVALVAMDVDHIAVHAVPGTVEPQTPALPDDMRPGTVAPGDVDSLLAAFNGGFQTVHGRYGMMVDGHTLLPPQEASCTVALYRDGRIRIASWPALSSSLAEMTAFRQTPECLVERGVRHPELENMYATSWGAVVGGKTVIRRSALGLSADGRTLFFGMGDSLTARTLADGMMAAGAHDVAQLDVNHVFPRFVFFERKPGSSEVIAGTPLCRGFAFSPGDYVRSPMLRDFFYVTRRVPGPS